MYLPTKDSLYERSEKDLFEDDYAIFSDFLYKGIFVGTHLNCNSNEYPQHMPL